ncbi:FixH family protein [Salisediminibacterium beveridgei]|uniref:YtkA-like domain-containing protein n=1 Tax=Salisediminibacterium beveridgei TaxID=632773 RepID=A0A1D7QXC4_9BACI|nr:FixH family protein [Salisediminibacterium beveridgei]AOM83657.1 hypothetical protein BBEV_2316 [Salisediminibacterium beveridgei]
MLKTGITAIFIAMIMAGCGNDEETNQAVSVEDVNLDQLEAELEVPEHAEPGEEVTFTAYVTQGEEEVDDASEVIFEIWLEDDKENSEMIEADLPGSEGVYSINFTIEEEDVYFVQPHITARGQHVMPVGFFPAGEADVPDDVDTEEYEHGDMSDHEHMENDHDENH